MSRTTHTQLLMMAEHSPPLQVVLEDHKAQELRGLHSDRTWNFSPVGETAAKLSFVCGWKLMWLLCNKIQIKFL